MVPGELTIITGVPNSGKSEWIDALMVNLADKFGWRFGLCSMEKKVSRLWLHTHHLCISAARLLCCCACISWEALTPIFMCWIVYNLSAVFSASPACYPGSLGSSLWARCCFAQAVILKGICILPVSLTLTTLAVHNMAENKQWRPVGNPTTEAVGIPRLSFDWSAQISRACCCQGYCPCCLDVLTMSLHV